MSYKFPVALAFLTLLLFLEGVRALQLFGIVPNLILLFFAILLTATVFGEHMRAWTFLALLLGFILISRLLFHFWFEPVAVLSVLSGGMYFVRRKLIGTPFLDFLVFTVAGTILVYGICAALSLAPFHTALVAWELVYNIVLGALVWGIVKYISGYYAGRS